MIALPDRNQDDGRETRLLMAECRGPAFPGFDLALAKSCMQLMDVVLWNRVANPRPFLAKHGTLLAVITAPGQFQGFQHYPNLNGAIVHRLQQMIDIANNPNDSRASEHADFINAAIEIADNATIPDPSPGTLVAWRTAGHGAPGSQFKFFRTVLGTSFFFLD